MASDPINNKTAILKSIVNEYSKSKQLFDVNGRLEFLYVAPVDVKNGEPCFVTQYSYVGLTAVVDYMKEGESVWQTIWETF